MGYRTAASISRLVAELKAQRPGLTVGTLRLPIDRDSDHTPWLNGTVRAADIMTTDGDRLAANLAAKLGNHPAMKSGAYVIWKQRIISADRKGEGWRMMEDRGDPTANHMDHVHVSVTRNAGPAGYDATTPWGALFTGGTTQSTNPGPAPSTPNLPGQIDTTPIMPGTGSPTPGITTTAGRPQPGLTPALDVGASLDDVRDGLVKLVLVGGALTLGGVLIALGAARATKPARRAASEALEPVADLAAATPQGRGLTAVATTPPIAPSTAAVAATSRKAR